MTNDHHSRNDDPSIETTPRQGHTTKPDHPVMGRPGSRAAPGFPASQVPTYPPDDAGGLPMAKTVVLPDGDPAQAAVAPAGGGAGGLMHLFEDEDAPTFVYGDNEQTSQQDVSSTSEASVLLVPDPNFGAEKAPAAPAPQAAPAAPAPPWSQPQGPVPAAAPAPPKKKSRVLLVVGIVLGVFGVLAGATLGISLFLVTGADRAATVVAAQPPVTLQRPPIQAPGQGSGPVKAPVPVPIPAEAPTTPTTLGIPVTRDTPAREEEASDRPGTESRAAESQTGPLQPTVPDTAAAPVEPIPSGVAAAPTAPSPAQVPIEGELADQLAPLTTRVRECTRRESGYSPRALTVRLVPSGNEGVRLRNITPPTPPRVAGCIARALEGVVWNAPAGVDQVTHTFDLQQ